MNHFMLLINLCQGNSQFDYVSNFILIKLNRFNEKFMGYGFDKNSHALQLAMAGYKFIGAHDVFVIHRAHEQSDWNGPDQKIQQVCKIFKNE